VKGKWVYLYRAVDSHGDTLDFMLSERRDEDAATAFFKQAINNNGFPDKVVMDKSGANYAGLANINLLLILAGFATMIDICQVKYLNNIIEGIISEFIHKCDRNPTISLCLRQNQERGVNVDHATLNRWVIRYAPAIADCLNI
jgi:transposase-like protein